MQSLQKPMEWQVNPETGINTMKIALEGKNLHDIRSLLEAENFEIVKDGSPELVVAYGGDGALLGAERKYPGIPKLPIRDSRTAPHCKKHSPEKQIASFLDGSISKSELIKVSGCCNDCKLLAINDIFIHNLDPVSAVRYRVWINDELYANEIVGDGVGIATVHGSTAYYRSITHSIFRIGIGLAFSNSTEVVNHLVLPEDSIIRIKITRGPAMLVADNAPERLELTENDEIILQKAQEKAVVYGLADFMCQKCRLLRHPTKYPFKNYPEE